MEMQILMTLLGVPVEWLSKITYEKIKQFSKKIEIVPLQRLLIKTFYKEKRKGARQEFHTKK